MPVAAYYAWDRAGRPLQPCQPVREIVTVLKAEYPRAAHLFGWYADDAHYKAVPAQDHTPFSQTGWPETSPYPYVFATDVAHRPDLGVDGHRLFAYWITEARAGRMPWLKYVIWQGRIYDARNGWRAQTSSGHYDHIHLSTRTDHQNTTLGSWSLLPGGDDVLTPEQAEQLAYVERTTRWEIRNWTAGTLQTVARTEAAVAALRGVIDGLVAVIQAGGGDVDTVAILAGVDERLAVVQQNTVQHIEVLKTEMRDAVADLGEGGASQVRKDQ